MPHLNRMTCMGHLGRDPELKQFSNGGAVCKAVIALKGKPKRSSDGKWTNETTWLDFQVFDKGEKGKAGTKFAELTRKGAAVYLEGMLVQDNWTDNTGAKKSRILLDVEDFQLLGERQQRAEEPQQEQEQATDKADVPF